MSLFKPSLPDLPGLPDIGDKLKPDLPGLPGLGKPPGIDGLLDQFHDDMQSLNPFDDILHATHGPGAPRDFVRAVNRSFSRAAFDLNNLTIDFDGDGRTDFSRFGRSGFGAADRTSTELMGTLQSHWSGINIGRHKDYITHEELNNYLVRVGDRIKPEDRRDLEIIMRSFRRISDADGRKADKGISYRDMSAYEFKNSAIDEIVLARRENQALKVENQRLRDELERRGENAQRPPEGGGGRVITERNEHKHYNASGADIPLSQKVFKRHYGIPDHIDLLKYMPGKDLKGEMPNFSAIAGDLGGLGGHVIEDDPSSPLKWNTPEFHSLKYDFSRNFAQVWPYLKALPIDKQEEFAFNFARTQVEVFKANGYELVTVDNEKVYHTGKDVAWIDFVEKVGDPASKIQWA